MSWTPWYSGVSQAIHWAGSGRLLSGKNVPLSRNSGLMTKRKMALKPTSFFWVAVKAMRHELKATPTRVATGMARIASGVRTIPNSVRTTRKTAARVPMRNALHASSPKTMLRTPRGVASIAS